MKNQRQKGMWLAVVASMVTLLTSGFAVAENKAPMTPELAAKREMVRKQQEQRIDHKQKQAAADTLKSERLKVYQAKQALKKTKPEKHKNKD